MARDIIDPEKKNLDRQPPEGQTSHVGQCRREEGSSERERISAFAPWVPGSDYTAFIDHLGVASLDLGFGGEDPGGVYHSAYDDFYWYTHFADTDFVYGKALAQTVGTMLMRLPMPMCCLTISPISLTRCTATSASSKNCSPTSRRKAARS